jgi:hypothetical protein
MLFQEGMVWITGYAMPGFLRPVMAPLKDTIWIGAGPESYADRLSRDILGGFFLVDGWLLMMA